MFGELHARSAFSFLQSSALPEDLVEVCAELNIPAIAQLDLNTLSGAPRFYKEAVKKGIKPILGAEIRLADESVVPLIVINNRGYRNLCRLISKISLRAPKGEAFAQIEDLDEFSNGLICLIGQGTLQNLQKETRAVRLDELTGIYGVKNTYIEIQRHFLRREEVFNQYLIAVAEKKNLPLVATNGVRYATPEQRPLLDALTCIKNHTVLETAGKLLSLNEEAHLKTPSAMREIFKDVPAAISSVREIIERIEFRLENLEYKFPTFPVPKGESEMSYLQKLSECGAIERYGNFTGAVRWQIEKELSVIEKLGLAGYFLTVWDIIKFCGQNDILAQGRGSAANSAVCYSLKITAVDPIGMELLFERFLSAERGEYPDIDIDLPSGDEREKVIQHVYETYGQKGAAMTSVVITYQGRSAAREIGKVMGFAENEFAKLAKLIPTHGYKKSDETIVTRFAEAGFDLTDRRVQMFAKLFGQIQQLPRHLGQHPGGMVISQVGLDNFVPLEPAAMPGRVILQWDKDDCGDLGIIKVDLLGLGMLAIIKETIETVRLSEGKQLEMAHLPPGDPLVYEALQKADTVGWFQVESRAQMSSLPRTRPAEFYDLVVQVAIIRPGPIVGDLAAPYVRRRIGLEPPESLHPLLDKALKRTLGVPIFQEQLLKMAMLIADFTGGEAEQLRRALGSKRSQKKMEVVEERLRLGMTKKNIARDTQDKIVKAITSFALYGFPESHAASFALIAYASGWLKCHYPAEFLAASLNNPHAGFYSSAVLIEDAERHGLLFLPIDINRSEWNCIVETAGSEKCLRMGLRYVRSLHAKTGIAIVEERGREGFFTSVMNLKNRVPKINKGNLMALAKSGALSRMNDKETDRRDAIWETSLAVQPAGPLFENLDDGGEISPLPRMNEFEEIDTDLRVTGFTTGKHPVKFIKENLGIEKTDLCADFSFIRNGRFAEVVGGVICRQRPGTAKGLVFLSLEDETGIINVVVMPDEYERYKMTVLSYSYLRIKGIVQNYNGSVSLKALYIEPLKVNVAAGDSHNFH